MGWIMACHIPNLVGRHYPLGKRLPRFSCIMSSPNQIYRYMRTDRQTDRRIDRQTDRQIEVGFFREVTRSSLVLYKLYHIYFLSHHWEQFFFVRCRHLQSWTLQLIARSATFGLKQLLHHILVTVKWQVTQRGLERNLAAFDNRCVTAMRSLHLKNLATSHMSLLDSSTSLTSH